MWRSIASNAFNVLIVLLFCAGGLIAWATTQYAAQGPLEQAICLKVERGSSMNRVSRALEARGAVSNARIFRLGVDYVEKSQLLKAGSHLVPAGASMAEIVDILTRSGQSTCGAEVNYRIGVNKMSVRMREIDPTTERFLEIAQFDPVAEELPVRYLELKSEVGTRFRVVIAEGVTSWQVVEGLKSVDILFGEVAELPTEGSLAPGSYEVRPDAEREALIDRMRQTQSRILAEAWAVKTPDLPLENPEQALILASIVEKETGVPEERRQVASVFVNRLRRNMKLQTDPTVIYGITKGQGVLGRGLRRSELRHETPWNTYVIAGLPPTPIANPGRASIAAVLQPAETDYLFFVADGTGGHAFASSLDEHNANVRKWRAIEAERAANP